MYINWSSVTTVFTQIQGACQYLQYKFFAAYIWINTVVNCNCGREMWGFDREKTRQELEGGDLRIITIHDALYFIDLSRLVNILIWRWFMSLLRYWWDVALKVSFLCHFGSCCCFHNYWNIRKSFKMKKNNILHWSV